MGELQGLVQGQRSVGVELAGVEGQSRNRNGPTDQDRWCMGALLPENVDIARGFRIVAAGKRAAVGTV
jgi:hypothetical protein